MAVHGSGRLLRCPVCGQAPGAHTVRMNKPHSFRMVEDASGKRGNAKSGKDNREQMAR